MTTRTESAPDWFTEAIATPGERSTTDVGGAQISFRAWGDRGAPGCVLVHGGAAHGGWWDHLAPTLAAGGFRVVAPDLSGHGDSDWRDRYSLDIWAREIQHVTEAAGADRDAVIVGHSLGGMVAFRAAATTSFRHVVMIDTQVFDEAAIERLRQNPPPISERVKAYGTRTEALRHYRLVPDHPSLPYVKRHVAEESVIGDGDGWRWKFDRNFAASMVNGVELLPITGPLTLIRAENGAMTQAMAERLQRLSTAPSSVTTIADAGHHVLLDQPLALLTELQTIL